MTKNLIEFKKIVMGILEKFPSQNFSEIGEREWKDGFLAGFQYGYYRRDDELIWNRIIKWFKK